MFSTLTKGLIASAVREILAVTENAELSNGEINFILHVDGKEVWSWANIQNNNKSIEVPDVLKQNMTVV